MSDDWAANSRTTEKSNGRKVKVPLKNSLTSFLTFLHKHNEVIQTWKEFSLSNDLNAFHIAVKSTRLNNTDGDYRDVKARTVRLYFFCADLFYLKTDARQC